jgi:hypothetical protein
LDDDMARIDAFLRVAGSPSLGLRPKYWTSAPPMIAELPAIVGSARLISLDHDLYRLKPEDPDPGTGRHVADALAAMAPVCPVLIHSTNTDAAWGMRNQLESTGWSVRLVHHLSQPDWIRDLWLPAAAASLAR